MAELFGPESPFTLQDNLVKCEFIDFTLCMQVPVDPRDAAIMQAIEDGDAAVQRVFQERLRASLYRTSQCLTDSQPPEGSYER